MTSKAWKLFLSRKTKIGANVFFQSLIVLALWAMVNYISSRHYYRFDVTSSHQFSLSDKTRKILKELKTPVAITTLYRPEELFRQVKDLLEEYVACSRRINVEHIDAERDRAKVELLANRLNMDLELNTVIFESEGRSKHVPQSDVVEYDYTGYPHRQPSKPKFKGEEAFTSAILSVTQEEQTSLYFVAGHGEKDIESFRRDGLSDLAKLIKRQNMKVKKLSLLKEENIPEDCHVLIIPGPTKKFSPDEKEVIDSYLEDGGKCLVMVDPLNSTGLEGLLRKWAVELGDDIVLDPVNRIPFAGPTTLFIGDYPYHAITETMRGVATIFSLVRSVDPISQNEKNLNPVSLAKTSDQAWGEINTKARKARFDEGEDKKGPISIGVAVSEKVEKSPYGGPEHDKVGKGIRLVVFGDSDFVSKAQIANPGNADLFLNSVNWLAEKEKLISIGPKSPDIRTVTLSHKSMVAIFWSTVAGLPFLGLLTGGVVWWRRRK